MKVVQAIANERARFLRTTGKEPTFVCLGSSEVTDLSFEVGTRVQALHGGEVMGMQLLIDEKKPSFLGVGLCTSRS